MNPLNRFQLWCAVLQLCAACSSTVPPAGSSTCCVAHALLPPSIRACILCSSRHPAQLTPSWHPAQHCSPPRRLKQLPLPAAQLPNPSSALPSASPPPPPTPVAGGAGHSGRRSGQILGRSLCKSARCWMHTEQRWQARLAVQAQAQGVALRWSPQPLQALRRPPLSPATAAVSRPQAREAWRHACLGVGGSQSACGCCRPARPLLPPGWA